MWSLHLSFAKRKCITPLLRLATMSECNLHSRCHAELEGIDFLVKMIYIYILRVEGPEYDDDVRAGNQSLLQRCSHVLGSTCHFAFGSGAQVSAKVYVASIRRYDTTISLSFKQLYTI